MAAYYKCEVESQGFLRFKHVSRVVEHLEAGDLCLLPSDSSYTLTGLPTEPGVGSDLDTVLQRKGLEMSLAFGSLRMASEWVSMSNRAVKFIGELTPGGLTFVALPVSEAGGGLATTRLHARGTIGVRLTESRVETQLAYEVGLPLTSTPVRNPDGSETRTADEALAVVANRVAMLPNKRRLAIIAGTVPYPGRWSTVTQEISEGGLQRIRVLREGRIPIGRVRQAARACRYEDAELGPAR